MRKAITFILSLVFSTYTYSQVVDGIILNSKKSNNDPYIELIKQASISDQKNENEKALEFLSQAIIMRPNENIGYSQRGHLKFKMNDFNGAIEDFTKYIELASDNRKSWGLASRGRAKMESNDYQGALDDFKSALSYEPNDGYSYYYQGLIFIKQGNKEKACESFSHFNSVSIKHWRKELKKALKNYCK
jgi:tetratricopeptide (TPR) repeat protein